MHNAELIMNLMLSLVGKDLNVKKVVYDDTFDVENLLLLGIQTNK